jgi:homocysteine S-methyltransferase
MNPLAPFLAHDGVLLLDGGLATALQDRGHDLDDALWSARLLLDDPAAIEAVHDDYLAAGADVATAASYQASLPGLVARGLSDEQARAVLRRSLALARGACDRAALARGPARPRPLAVASLGAYGAYLADGSEYRGDYTADDAAILAYHRERLDVLAPLADLVACETIPCLREAELLGELLAHCPTPAWVSFSCRDDAHVAHGEPIERCVAAITAVPAVVAVGINCCAPRHVEGLVERLRHATLLPIVAYPNAGERYHDGRWCGERASPSELAALAARWHAAGARILGGCCRTTPAHIAALHRLRQGLPAPT